MAESKVRMRRKDGVTVEVPADRVKSWEKSGWKQVQPARKSEPKPAAKSEEK